MFSIALCLFNLLFMTARVVLDVAHLTSDIQKHCRPAKSTEVLLWIHQFEIKSHGFYLRQQKPHSNNKQTDNALHRCPNVTWYCVNTHTHTHTHIHKSGQWIWPLKQWFPTSGTQGVSREYLKKGLFLCFILSFFLNWNIQKHKLLCITKLIYIYIYIYIYISIQYYLLFL